MESLIFALEAVMPIILMVAIGYIIKKIGFLTVDMRKVINKLVFRIFLPVMLFLNVYKIESLSLIEFDYILYALIATTAIFLLAIPCVILITDKGAEKGDRIRYTHANRLCPDFWSWHCVPLFPLFI